MYRIEFLVRYIVDIAFQELLVTISLENKNNYLQFHICRKQDVITGSPKSMYANHIEHQRKTEIQTKYC